MLRKEDILHLRVPPDIKVKLDDLRRLEPDIPTRSEMVRRLIERAREKIKEGAERH